MPTLNIGGQKITVGDDFLAMSPEQQNAAVDEISKSLPSAPAKSAIPAAPDDGRNTAMGKIDSAVRGAADTLTFGLSDEIAAGLGAATGIGGTFGDFSGNLAKQRGTDKADADQRAAYRLAGQISGGLAGGVGLAKSGLSMGANAAQAGQGLARVAAGSAGDAAIMGGLQGAGSGEGLGGRLEGAGAGAAVGGVLGAAAPLAVSGLSTITKPFIAPIMSRLRPDVYAERAIGEGLRRSGTTADDIAARLQSAQADGQDVFTVADAMGNAGQRMLSTVARNPSDARQGVVDALLSRQMDQGRRVAGALQDASGTPLTAAQYQEMLTAQRGADAVKNYAPVKTDITPIDVSGPVAKANAAISPAADRVAVLSGKLPTDLAARSGIETGEASIRDPIRQAVKEARSYLASPTSTVNNVEKAFRAKTNMDQMIATATEKGQGALVAELIPVRDALDNQLAATSKQYASARDAYRVASGNIDAVDTGKAMAAPRTRPGDNLATFGALPTEEAQRSARIGYFDPLISRAENQAGSMSNSARPLISESARQELPAFAHPGTAPQLGRRLGREQRMFETSNAALGGSKTADNLADAIDTAKYDPSIMSQLLRGRFIDAAISTVARGVNESQGVTKPVIERIAKALMERDPEVARRLLTQSADIKSAGDAKRAIVNAMLANSGAAGAGRLTAP